MGEEKFSIFYNGIRNTIPNGEISVNDFLKMIKEDTPLFQKIRAEKTKERKNELKKKLSYVTFGGTFSKRAKENLKESSGLACLDFDDVENLETLKQQLSLDKFTHCIFVSPSGKGLKLIVKIPSVKTDEEYKSYWLSIAKHYKIGITDEACKDISRACYLSYDSKPFFNPNSEVYADKENTSLNQFSETSKGKDESNSGLEYRRAIALFREGKSREEVIKKLMAYKKFADSSEQYRELTLDKAETFVLDEQESKSEFSLGEEENKLLKNKNFFDILIKELDKKVEGEEKSKRAILLSLCSVWVKDSEVPLNSLVSSESSAGKSFVCKNIIKLFPKELVEYRTKITPEAFTYWKREEDWNWDGKICYLEDISQSILDAPTFKVMCSEGSTATIVIKQRAVDIEIQGKPVMLVTTARTNPNSEILNRFQIISLDESKEQTRAIVFRQAQQKNGIKYDEKIVNALRGLKRKNVFIPFAERIADFLDENYNFESLRLRRDFSRLLDLIKCSAVLHQYQRREIDSETIEANEQDYQIAREVINYIQTATFKGLTHKLKKAYDFCKELGEFTAKEIWIKHPIGNQKTWYNWLEELAERNMIQLEIRNLEGEKKDGSKYVVKTTYYIAVQGTTFELPHFETLPQKITKVTIGTNDTNDTKVTNDNKNKGNDCNDCNDYSKREQENYDIDFSKSGIKEVFESGSN